MGNALWEMLFVISLWGMLFGECSLGNALWGMLFGKCSLGNALWECSLGNALWGMLDSDFSRLTILLFRIIFYPIILYC